MFGIISQVKDFSELKKPSVKLAEFAQMINEFMKMSKKIKISELISKIIEKSGMLEEYEKEKTVEADSRIENIKEFITAALEYEAVEQEEHSLEDFLSNISLVSDIDNLAEEDNYVALMTMHNAKGLEFPIVFLVGMEDGVFPGYRSMTSEPNQMEEERRLCYVAITRAKEKIYLTGTKCRTLFGSTTYNRKSKFLYEIPGKYIDESIKAAFSKPAYTKNKIGLGSFKTVESFFEEKKVMKDIDFKVGDKVEHKKFGVGIVKKIEKENDDFKVEIKFENFGMKRLMAAYAELKILS